MQRGGPISFEMSPPSHCPHHTTSSPPSSSSSSRRQPSTAEEEDLLALLSSDTFSLESQRDRDLIHLGSFLSNLIPTPSQPLPIPISTERFSPPNQHHHPFNHQNQFAGSPMSYHSNASSGTGPSIPPAPSSSLNNNPPLQPPPSSTAAAAAIVPMIDFSNFNGFGGWGKELEGFKGKESTSFNQSRWNTVSGGNSRSGSGENTPRRRRSSNMRDRGGAMEWRVPNCSRERGGNEDENTNSAIVEERNRERFRAGQEESNASGGGWKSRLRKSTVDQQQQQQQQQPFGRTSGRGYDDDHGGGGQNREMGDEREEEAEEEEDDLMMDE